MSDREPAPEGSPFGRAADELALQAWLARAELRHPSRSAPGVREELTALAGIRDELRLQVALDAREGREEFARLEERWARLRSSAERAADEAGESRHDRMSATREGYWTLGRRGGSFGSECDVLCG